MMLNRVTNLSKSASIALMVFVAPISYCNVSYRPGPDVPKLSITTFKPGPDVPGLNVLVYKPGPDVPSL